MKPIEQPRRHSRGFELYMQMSFVEGMLVASAWGDQLADAVIGVPHDKLSDELDRAVSEYSALDSTARVRAQLARRHKVKRQ